jgi:hypothetical protein
MWLMLQQALPDDYVIATGRTHTVREFVRVAFEAAGLGSYEPYVVVDPRFVRPAEVDLLIGDPASSGTYASANPSIRGNRPHNPFTAGQAQFLILVPGLQAGATVTSATFTFSTNAAAAPVVGSCGSPLQ